MKKLKKIIKNLKEAETLEEVDKASKEASEYYQLLTDSQEKDLLKKVMMTSFEKSKKKVEKLNKKYDSIMSTFEKPKRISIFVDEKEYLLSDWVTIQNYCKMFDIESTSVVTNWIKRGKISSENMFNSFKSNIFSLEILPLLIQLVTTLVLSISNILQ